MKKILQSVAVLATAIAANNAVAQIVPTCPSGLEMESYMPTNAYTTANPGNHIYEMGTWDIDSILNSGSTVILDLFGTWCPPCWSYHEGHELNDLYSTIGQGGDNSIAIFAVDASTQGNDFEGTGANNGQGDWIDGTKYPMVDMSSFGSTFNVSGFPTLIAICPDRTISEISRTSATATNLTTIVGNCGALATDTDDPRILSADGTTTSYGLCGETSTNGDIIVTVQNYSTAAINGSYTIKAYDAANMEVATTDATLNLDAYETQEVNIGSVALTSGANVFSAKITTANDETNNDDLSGISVQVDVAEDLPIITNGFGANTVNVAISLDTYPGEVGLVFNEGTPTQSIVATYNGATDANTLGLETIGSMSGSSFEGTYTVNGVGCHYFAFVDSENDGINWNGHNGNAVITGNNSSITVDGDWGQGTFVLVNLTDGGTPLTIEENAEFGLSVFPNPANNNLNVALNLNVESNVTINIVNTLGQTVYSEALGNINGQNTVNINTTDLVEGIYLVNTTVNGTTSTERISIVK
jgi:hypothetical protein